MVIIDMFFKKLANGLALFLFIFLIGCGDYRYFGRASPPAEAYWSKTGFSMKETKDFMDKKCFYSENEKLHGDEWKNGYYEFQRCMLRNGFVYMKDAYDITSKGFLPLRKDALCRPRKGEDISPACQSIYND